MADIREAANITSKASKALISGFEKEARIYGESLSTFRAFEALSRKRIQEASRLFGFTVTSHESLRKGLSDRKLTPPSKGRVANLCLIARLGGWDAWKTLQGSTVNAVLDSVRPEKTRTVTPSTPLDRLTKAIEAAIAFDTEKTLEILANTIKNL